MWRSRSANVLLGLPARSAVNIPGLSAEIMERLKPHLQLAETVGGLVSQLSGGQVQELELRLQGDFASHPSQPLVIASLKGLLGAVLGDSINFVNASLEAKARGIRVLEVKDEASRDYAGGSLQLISRGDQGSRSVTGAVFADGELRITSIDEFPSERDPQQSHVVHPPPGHAWNHRSAGIHARRAQREHRGRCRWDARSSVAMR